MKYYNALTEISQEGKIKQDIYKVQYSNSNKFLINRAYDCLRILKKYGEVTLSAIGRAIGSMEKIIEIIRIKRPDFNYFIKRENNLFNENVQYLIIDSKHNQKEIIKEGYKQGYKQEYIEDKNNKFLEQFNKWKFIGDKEKNILLYQEYYLLNK